jgi:hypothetical protein
MITITYGSLWVLLAIWIAVVTCSFMFGWHAGGVIRDHSAPATQRPAPRPPLPRTGLLESGDPARWWPSIELAAGPPTAPISRHAIELSNWEKNLARNQRQWEYEQGIRRDV